MGVLEHDVEAEGVEEEGLEVQDVGCERRALSGLLFKCGLGAVGVLLFLKFEAAEEDAAGDALCLAGAFFAFGGEEQARWSDVLMETEKVVCVRAYAAQHGEVRGGQTWTG